MTSINSGKPLWVLKAVQKGKLLRASKKALLHILPVLQKAEEPMTAGEVANALFWQGDKLPVHKALGLLHQMGLLKSTRVPARHHPFATLECAYELLDLDSVINKD